MPVVDTGNSQSRRAVKFLITVHLVVFANLTQADQLIPEKLVFVYGRPESAPTTQWHILVVEHALSKLQIAFEFREIPSKRASLYANSGKVDGELGRVFDYGEKYPNLVRVSEHHTLVTFCAFGIDPNIQVDGWPSLKDSALRVDYRMGLKKVEEYLPSLLPGQSVSGVRNIEQGIGRLLLDRTDIYIDIQDHVYGYLESDLFDKRFPKVNIVKVGELETSTGHIWLHKKHAHLERALSSILREMKSDGLFRTFQLQVGLTADEIRW